MSKTTLRIALSSWENIIIRNVDEDLALPYSTGYKKTFVDDLPVWLFESMKHISRFFNAPVALNGRFTSLTASEKLFWQDYAGDIPWKLRSLNLHIRKYENFCRTCLITHSEVEQLAENDFDKWRSEPGKKSGRHVVSDAFRLLDEDSKRFFMELNYVIPLVLKKAGFEIVREEEIASIDNKVVLKIARAIHSRYLRELRKQNSAEESPGDFDSLEDDIKYSNIDNAYHIPTKLLAIGYRIRKVKKGNKPFALHLSNKEIELMSGIEHLRWSWDKRLNGWTYGKTKDSSLKIHPGLVPYNELPESEKEKDRELIRMIPAILQDIDYETYPVNPYRIKKLSYAVKPQSSINRILEETRELNEQIRSMVKIPARVEKMVSMRNKKIEDAINEIEGSYNYARHIQESFLPDDLFVRECFPESFILYKPKDIVSGDFYFFSNRDGKIIFAAADCTGHGIPGAFLSIVGYGIIDQAVNELNLTEPHMILDHIYTRIHRFLRYEAGQSGVRDDLDIVLCTLDIKENLLKWAGVGNPLLRISAGQMIEYKANNKIKAGQGIEDCPFISDTIKLETGDSLYMSSDGFIDQFGGPEHKKYSSLRLRNFLLSIDKNSMPEQSEMLYEEFEHWREAKNEDQTDDILIIGLRI